jgi:hypothetical protein
VAQQALAVRHQRIRLWRVLPGVESELGVVIKAEHDATESVCWEGMLRRDDARLTHRIKTLYGFNTIIRLIKDKTTRSKAGEALLYLMA